MVDPIELPDEIRPQYEMDDFVEYENRDGKIRYMRSRDFSQVFGFFIEQYSNKWFCRLITPGYSFATDWEGPFDRLEDAYEYVRGKWKRDPKTGSLLEEKDE